MESPLEYEDQYTQMKGILQLTTLYTLEKLTSKQFYWAFIRKRDFIPTSKAYYADLYDIDQKNWLLRRPPFFGITASAGRK